MNRNIFRLKILVGLVFLTLTLTHNINAQNSGNVMLAGGLDIIKSDINSFAGKVQTGLEAHYFINRSFSADIGFEIWSDSENSFVFGIRYYPGSRWFARARGLLGVDDFSLGGGYSHPLTNNWRVEGIADYYFDQGELGIRAGLAYIFRR